MTSVSTEDHSYQTNTEEPCHEQVFPKLTELQSWFPWLLTLITVLDWVNLADPLNDYVGRCSILVEDSDLATFCQPDSLSRHLRPSMEWHYAHSNGIVCLPEFSLLLQWQVKLSRKHCNMVNRLQTQFALSEIPVVPLVSIHPGSEMGTQQEVYKQTGSLILFGPKNKSKWDWHFNKFQRNVPETPQHAVREECRYLSDVLAKRLICLI